jgi:hypothetical protein
MAPFLAAATPNDSIPIDTLLLDDGSMYMGQIRDSLFNGQGTCIYADGTVYQGEWKDGLWHGKGTLVYPDGDIYKGSFVNHVKQGRGVYVYGSGARYDGEWKNDMFNGKGTLRFEDGGIYDGAWKDDMKHGYGKLYSSTGFTSTGYFYFDEFLGMPFDTEIDQDSTLTDELKEWGFKHEYPHPHVYFSLGASYSATGMTTCSLLMDIKEKHFYWGLAVGINLEPPIKGVRTGMGWYMFENDIHMTGEYISSQYLMEGGLLFGKWSIGGSFGMGIVNVYMNCRANNPGTDAYGTYWRIKYGMPYNRNGSNGLELVYRGCMRYSIHLNKQPKALMYLGYGKADGLFVGVAGYLK